jgi:hypothetical protein
LNLQQFGWHALCIQGAQIQLSDRNHTGVSKVHSYNKTALAVAVMLSLSGAAVQAQPTNDIKSLKGTVEELRKQLQELKKGQRTDVDALEKARVDELRKQVEELRALLKKQTEAKAAEVAAAPVTEGESQESIDARTSASKADIQGLRTDLENYKYDNARQLERNVPSVARNTKIGGSVTVGYSSRNPKVSAGSDALNSGFGPTESRSNGFNAAALGLNFAGTLYRDYGEGKNLTYRLALNAAATNGTTTTSATDAYLRYSFQPVSGNAEDPLGTITLGQQVVPFGQDAQALDQEVKAVINNALFVAGLGLNVRQTGLIVAGDYDPYVDYTNNYRAPLVSYALGVVNGNGANRADNNSNKDFLGRLVYTLPVDYANWLRQLQLGVSYVRGYDSIGPANATATTDGTKGLNTRTGFDINWTHLPFSVSYEWAYGKKRLNRITSGATRNDLTNPDGYQRGVGQYINFGYTWGEQFLNSSKNQGKFDDFWPKSYQAFLRFDTFDPNRSGTALSDHVYETTVGLNVFFAETTKFQVNYVHRRTQLGSVAPTAATPARTNGVVAQFSATF